MVVRNIKWDTDGDKEEFLDDVSDWLSDEYGFCHFGFDEPVEE